MWMPSCTLLLHKKIYPVAILRNIIKNLTKRDEGEIYLFLLLLTKLFESIKEPQI